MKNQIKRYAKIVSKIAIVLIAAVTVTACGKKKNNAAQPIPGPVVPVLPCPSCVASSQLLMTSLSGVYGSYIGGNYIELGLEFYSDGATSFSGQDPYFRYSGPAFAHGTMYVTEDMTPGSCSLPVGTYVVRPLSGQPAELHNEVMHNLMLEAVGPISVKIYIPSGIMRMRTNAQIGRDGKTYPFRMTGVMYMEPYGVLCSGGFLSKMLE